MIALSTMEAEYISLSDSMKHLLVLKRLAVAICNAVQLNAVEVANIWSTKDIFTHMSALDYVSITSH
jgi:hypothetical protein